MKFATASKYHQLSECGKFTVSKATDKFGDWQYFAWTASTKTAPGQHIAGPFKTAAEAQQACRDYARAAA